MLRTHVNMGTPMPEKKHGRRNRHDAIVLTRERAGATYKRGPGSGRYVRCREDRGLGKKGVRTNWAQTPDTTTMVLSQMKSAASPLARWVSLRNRQDQCSRRWRRNRRQIRTDYFAEAPAAALRNHLRIDGNGRIRYRRDWRTADPSEMDVAERKKQLTAQRKKREPSNPAAIGSEPTHAKASMHRQAKISQPPRLCKPFSQQRVGSGRQGRSG